MDEIMKKTLEEQDKIAEEPTKPTKKGLWIYGVALLLILLILLMVLPPEAVKLDPRPQTIPPFEEVFLFEDINLSTKRYDISTPEQMALFIEPGNPVIKTTANRIVTLACNGEKVCHAKAIYGFVKQNFNYISDPVNFEYVEKPADFMISGGGDCESGTLLMAALLESVGIDAQLVFIPGHAYLRIRLPEALSRYKIHQDWVYLDWTCNNCKFGELPPQNIKIEQEYGKYLNV